MLNQSKFYAHKIRRHGSTWIDSTGSSFKGLFTDPVLKLPAGTPVISGSVLSRQELPEVYIVTGSYPNPAFTTVHVLRARLSAKVLRAFSGPKDAFGRTQGDAVTVHDAMPVASTQAPNIESGSPDGVVTTSYIFAAPLDYDVRHGDKLDIDGASYRVLHSEACDNGVTQIFADKM